MVLEWGLAHVADTAELVASEMVTNSVQASGQLRTIGTPIVRITVASDQELLVIRVWDGNDNMPVRQDAGPGDESGRGLMIIDALSADWGSCRDADGKVVWAMISLVQGPGIS